MTNVTENEKIRDPDAKMSQCVLVMKKGKFCL